MLPWDVIKFPTVDGNDDSPDCQQSGMLLFHPTKGSYHDWRSLASEVSFGALLLTPKSSDVKRSEKTLDAPRQHLEKKPFSSLGPCFAVLILELRDWATVSWTDGIYRQGIAAAFRNLHLVRSFSSHGRFLCVPTGLTLAFGIIQ
jgi:hypothetical protein